MMNPTTPANRRPCRAGTRRRPSRGLSVSEVLISLAITSMLLTAIAAAFHSSSQIITENDEFFRATQAGRVALNQMLTEIRRADNVPAQDSVVQATETNPQFTVRGITADLLPVSRPLDAHMSQEYMRYYRYDAPTRRLMLYFQDAKGQLSPEYPLATNVQQSPFSWEASAGSDNSVIASRVSIALEIVVGNNRIRLSGSAVPRRSIKYEQ